MHSFNYRLRLVKLAAVSLTMVLLTACGQPDIVVSTPPPPAEWLTCQAAPERPTLDPLATYSKPEVDARDSVIARYIIDLRAAHFSCWSNLERIKDYYAK